MFTPTFSHFLLTKLLTQTFLPTSCYRVRVASRSRIVIIILCYAVSVYVTFILKFTPALFSVNNKMKTKTILSWTGK